MAFGHSKSHFQIHMILKHKHGKMLLAARLKGITNSAVCFERVREQGYTGSQSTIKNYINANRYLVQAKRQIAAPQGSRGRRYETDSGESYNGKSYKIVCFAMGEGD